MPGALWNVDEVLEPAGRQAGLLDQLALGGELVSARRHVAQPGGQLEQVGSSAARNWRTRVTVPSSCSGTTATAPGWRTMSRSNSPAGLVGEASTCTTRNTWLRTSSTSPSLVKAARSQR